MSKEAITVFISSRFEEFSSLRKMISEKKFEGLDEIGLAVKMLDHRNGIADSRSPTIASMEEATNSDIFVLFLGETYSEFLDNNNKSYTHLEYDIAIDRGIKILAFPVGDCYNPDNEKLSDNPVFGQWQERVLRNNIHITAPHTPSNYDVDELYNKINSSLKELIKQIIHKQWDNNEPCPYDPKNLHKNQNLIFQTMIWKYNFQL
jgi:hypothetical protein